MFIYTNNKVPGKETKRTILFVTASTQSKDERLLHRKYKPLKKEIQKDRNKWKDILFFCVCIKTFNAGKMSVPLSSMQSLTKPQWRFLKK